MKSGISKIIIMCNYFCVMGYHRLLNAQVSRLPRQDIVPTTIFSVEYVISQTNPFLVLPGGKSNFF